MIATLNDTHDPSLRSWVRSANDGVTDFPIQNLPFGVFRRRLEGDQPRVGVAIGDQIVDLSLASTANVLGHLSETLRSSFRTPSLNVLMGHDPSELSRLRGHLSYFLQDGNRQADQRVLVPMRDAELLLPIECGDYTDFYASIFHATNVGTLFRPDNPLLPNFKYVPIAYHGRASSLVVSGKPIIRPSGQIKKGDAPPAYAPTEKLDYEVEIGFVIGRGNPIGRPISIDDADDHVFGVCIVNDWSARDIQTWEYQPLGPFLAKSFATTVSPWVVTLEALAPYRTKAFDRPSGDPAPLPHLRSTENEERGGIDLELELGLRSEKMRAAGSEPARISRGSLREMYWTMAQMVAHHTSNGCNLRPGDLLASGTVSGAEAGSEGCLLERTRSGPIDLPSGEKRTFLVDGDEVIVRAVAVHRGAARIGFGPCAGRIVQSS